jgi:DNA repair exonuclease SbcCD ATPase subunit
MRRRRSVEVFSLSFLDCICCGFGAIILLLVLTEIGRPVVLEKSRKNLDGQIRALSAKLHTLRGETDELTRELEGSRATLEQDRQKLARLSGDLSAIQGQYASSTQDASVANRAEKELVAAYQKLSAEMERVLQRRAKRPATEAIGGIPVDSEYIVFVVDTSDSMTDNH